jgi:hypothetical protein
MTKIPSSILIILYFILSCSAPIKNIPTSITTDIEDEIIYFKSSSNIFEEFTGNKISSINIKNKNLSLAYSGNYLKEILSNQEFIPFISPTGKYAICNNRFKILGKLSLSVYDLYSGKVISKITTDRIAKTYHAEPIIIHWAKDEDIFYYSNSDTIYQFDPLNYHKFIACIPNLHSFIISPNKKMILTCYKDNIGIFDTVSNQFMSVYTMKNIIGMTKHSEIKLCWSPNSNSFCFTDGRQIIIYNLTFKKFIKYKSSQDIFYITTINDNYLIYVRGSYPNDGSQYQSTEEFSIVKLNIKSGLQDILHSRVNHEPFSIQPQQNNSVLLFSELKLNGGYQVKLLSIDGRYMNTVCNGIYPSWRYNEL